jgi:hypothetical protein
MQASDGITSDVWNAGYNSRVTGDSTGTKVKLKKSSISGTTYQHSEFVVVADDDFILFNSAAPDDDNGTDIEYTRDWAPSLHRFDFPGTITHESIPAIFNGQSTYTPRPIVQ